ncbi:MAG: hypothetical protein ACOY3J_02185 [Bacillota bacterium]|uniref:Uncharacterized protein n=1 Tax=Thermanaerosceptrum fracticalcis TaxID=1712410 RepID=A0A7G6E4W3_THEFR|nr:hypothetical protein [Thermanaerosceptrum fracticalcis]QNB47117.1 hypothetical protein BR63_12845 [Thermanaerosceptrum fracticalcis]
MLENIFALRDVISMCGGKIRGRKKIQKIIYILQELSDPPLKPYQFKWNYYGVYSEELANDLSVGESFGILKENEEEEYGYRTYIIEAVDSSNPTRLCRDQNLKSIVQYLSQQETRVLEVLSSIIFFKNEGLDGEELKGKLHTFKGHLAAFFDQAFAAYDELFQILH